MSRAIEGSKVKVHYIGKLDDGTIFDSSTGGDPLEFTIGKMQVLKGLEEAIIGMNTGDKKNITIEPKKGFGSYRDDLVYEIHKENIPENIELKTGNKLKAKDESSNTYIDLFIVEVTKNTVKLDANHPLAGKNLNFEIELIEVETILD